MSLFFLFVVSIAVSVVAGVCYKVYKIKHKVSVARDYFNKQPFRIESREGSDETVYIYVRERVGYVNEMEYLNEKREHKRRLRGTVEDLMNLRLERIESGNTIVFKNGVPCSKD